MTASRARLAQLGPDRRRALADALRRQRETTAVREGPLSAAQQRLWFLEQLAPGRLDYVETSVVRSPARLDPLLWQRALAAVVDRHESLRTVFLPQDGTAVQRVLPALPPDFAHVALPSTAAPALVAERLVRRFDLAQGPLLRALCVDVGGIDIDGGEQWLALSMHHIVCDGWSMANLAREVAAFYEALAQGRRAALPPLPLQALDVALWQAAWRKTPAGIAATDAGIAFWQQQLAGAPPLQLPADRPVPTASTGGGQVPITVPRVVADALHRLCEREGATLFMAGLAGFLAMLHRWTGQDDLVVGCPVAGRDRVELEPLIGFFVNAVVIRVDFAGDPGFRTMLGRTRDSCLASFAHQHIPFEHVVEAVAPPREAGSNPLFQAIFQWHANAPDALLADAPGLPPPIPKFPLRCDLWPDGTGGIAGMLEYSDSLFDRPTIEAMARGLAALLAAMARTPDRPVAEAPLLTPAEEAAALAQARGPHVPPADARSITARIAAIAAATPDRPAITDADGTMTYAALEGASDALAHRLQVMGITAGDRVAIALDSPAMRIAAALAAMKLGAAYLPLDPAAPAARTAAILADAQPLAWITDGPAVPGEPPRLDPGNALSTPAPSGVPHEPDSIAYVIYTSGSTGQPLGVEIPHRGLENLVEWHLAAHELTADDRATLIASPSFDASVWECWSALAVGASLHAPPPSLRIDPAGLARWMAAEAITIAFLPTPLAEAFFAAPPPPTLRRLLTGGDRLRTAPSALPYRVFNHYGPTEASVVATFGEVLPGEAGPPLIGRPIHNLAAHVLDDHGRPVPAGAIGELHIGGIGLARGYVGNPPGARSRFVSGGLRGARLFRSGDLVQRLHTGALRFVGRRDSQIKVRGIRIEPAEIEAVLTRHPAVEAALVTQLADGRLAALIVPRGAEAPPDAAALRAHARAHLPAAMVPAAWCHASALPLTDRGKRDPAAAAARFCTATVIQPSGPPPTHAEAALTALWQRLLAGTAPGRHDNFFDVGGHSLLLVRLQAGIAETFGCELPLVELFDSPTIALQARAIYARRTAPATTGNRGEAA